MSKKDIHAFVDIFLSLLISLLKKYLTKQICGDMIDTNKK